MGHANLSNISEFFIKRLQEVGTLTIAECANLLESKGEKVHASEGDYEDNCMIRMALGQVVEYLSQDDHFLDRDRSAPIIIPTDLNPEQERILAEWKDDKCTNWDCGNDGNGGEFAIFDSIRWKYNPIWRSNYKRIPILGNVSV